MQRLISTLLVLVSFLFVISCEKTKEPISSNTEEPPKVSHFPLTVGSSWKYAIVDTLIYTYTGETEIHHDTVDVTIIDSTILPNGENAVIWQYVFRNETDSLFACLSNDTLFFYDTDGNHLVLKFGFVLPLQVSNEWEFLLLDYRVFQKDSVQVPAGLFVDVFHVREREKQGNSIGWNDFFIAPKVGIVKYRYSTIVTLWEVNHKIGWELLTYQIVE